jgi:hypothetical protein
MLAIEQPTLALLVVMLIALTRRIGPLFAQTP